jgi:hypothetical protein
MSTFWVYRKGQKEPIVVKAEASALKDGVLTFTVGTETVACFPYSEVQGWQKTEMSVGSGVRSYGRSSPRYDPTAT